MCFVKLWRLSKVKFKGHCKAINSSEVLSFLSFSWELCCWILHTLKSVHCPFFPSDSLEQQLNHYETDERKSHEKSVLSWIIPEVVVVWHVKTIKNTHKWSTAVKTKQKCLLFLSWVLTLQHQTLSLSLSPWRRDFRGRGCVQVSDESLLLHLSVMGWCLCGQEGRMGAGIAVCELLLITGNLLNELEECGGLGVSVKCQPSH